MTTHTEPVTEDEFYEGDYADSDESPELNVTEAPRVSQAQPASASVNNADVDAKEAQIFDKSGKRAAVKPEYIVERQGKMFVLYAGLLDYATQMGLWGIRTDMLQPPKSENGFECIFCATVTMKDPVSGELKTFSGHGDANQKNTNGMPPIRMAETRSKARALRDAVNIGVASFEERGADDTPPPARPATQGTQRPPAGNNQNRPQGTSNTPRPVPHDQQRPQRQATQPVQSQQAQDGQDRLISNGQVNTIMAICKRKGWDAPVDLREQWTEDRAKRWIIKNQNAR